MEHSPTSATCTAWERTPWRATQRAAWEVLKKEDRMMKWSPRFGPAHKEDMMMQRKTFCFVSVVLSAAMLVLTFGPVHAQTLGAICEFDATGVCAVDSPIFDSGGNIGIGNRSPQQPLAVGNVGPDIPGGGTGFAIVGQSAVGAADATQSPDGTQNPDQVTYILADGADDLFGLNAFDYALNRPLDITIGWGGRHDITLAKDGGFVSVGRPFVRLTGLNVFGDLTVFGSKNAVVPLQDGQHVALTAEESTEVWFSDYGSVQLVKGRAVVQIDHVYLQTVNTEKDYHVFLTARGNPKGALYIDKETPSTFEIRESTGTASIKVSYRIVAKRKDYADERLKKVETPVASRERTTDSPQK
jgi:hypothetical protein